jgi:hypothetical protein
MPITHVMVAKEAGVGRATLYRHHDLVERVTILVDQRRERCASEASIRTEEDAAIQLKILSGLRKASI